MKFKTIIADPPWEFRTWSQTSNTSVRKASAHYDTHETDAMTQWGQAVQSVAEDDCCLFLWTCPPLLYEAIELAHSWGFTYKTKAFTWVKLTPKRTGFHYGLGYWTRANTEDVWLCTRGKPERKNKNVAQLLATLETPAVMQPLGRHSAKPEEVQDRIERLVDGPYLELFARRYRPGWVCLGNELDGLDITESLRRTANDEPLPRLPRPVQLFDEEDRHVA